MKITLGFSLMMLIIMAQSVFGQEDYNKWAKEQEREYKEFVSRQDREFIGFLKENWINVPVNQGTGPFRLPESPKPVVFSPRETHEQPVESPISGPPEKSTSVYPSPSPSQQTMNQPAAKIPPAANAQTTIHPGTPTLRIDYFGKVVTVPEERSLSIPFMGAISNDAVADYWTKLCRTDYKVLLDRLGVLRNELDLNDWGYCKLIFETARRIDDNDRNSSYLLTWFMLVKSGYLSRIGYQGDDVYLLISTENLLYNVPFFHMGNGGARYYVLLLRSPEKEPSGAILTYKNNYPEASRRLNFGFTSLPQLGNAIDKRVIKVDYGDKHYSFHIDYNKDLIEFYRYYPTTDLSIYFASQMSRPARETLLTELRSAVQGMSQTEAVSFLLHFVQYATGYKTDSEQFGYQKFFFPEENLYYGYTDCADRAIFFSYLVKDLLGLRVIGLEYTDHLSTAVKFTTDVSGDYVTYGNEKYIICDPTYIGAPIGEAMPKYLHMSAKVVE